MSILNTNIIELINNKKIQKNIILKGLVPILNGEELFIYKISANEKQNEELNKLKEELDKETFTYYIDLLDKKQLDNAINNQQFTPFFYNAYDHRNSTKEDIIKYYELDDKQKYDHFIEKHKKEFEEEYSLDLDSKQLEQQNMDIILEKLASNHLTFIFKIKSKLCEIIDFLSNNNYINIYTFTLLTTEFLYNKEIELNEKDYRFTEQEKKLIESYFNKEEENLPIERKIEIIKEIINNLNIELIYNKKINNISDTEIKNILGIKDKNLLINFSKRNFKTLNNSELYNIYKSKSEKIKILK